MLDNHHLVGMAPETKRSALLMALDAAGAGIDDLLQDAVLRQRALNDYDEAQQRHLREFEALKASENTTVQANLDRLTREHMSRIQSNLDSVAREQDKVRNWQRMKRQESQRIADAAAFCVPPNGPGGGLAQVLERATTARR
jgi:small-conductance mechanosensitive channel